MQYIIHLQGIHLSIDLSERSSNNIDKDRISEIFIINNNFDNEMQG